MNRTLVAAAASLALAVPGVAVAQTTVATDAAGNVYVMTDAQRGMYDTWPAERRTMYDAWPNDYKVYYWTLTPEQQNGWWVLNDDQRTRVYAMTPQQRAAAWTAIMAQMGASGASTSASANMNASAGSVAGNMRFVSNAVVQNIAEGPDQPTGEVPVCAPNQQDNCINAWEAGRRGPNVDKPLGYWPGKPASEQ